MKKKLFFFSTIILTLAGCTSEDYVGNDEHKWENENGKAISLNLVAAPQTRAVVGSEAAGLLNNNFVIYGMKSFDSPATTQVVFNNYQANYGASTAGTTTSNSNDWEYVGYKNLPYGTTTSSGGTLNNDGVATNATASGIDQSIKYWDYSASKYEFFGYSLGGTSTTTSWATSTAMSPYTFKLSGTQAQLSACYISDLLTKTDMSATNTSVQLQFRKMESNVRIALYETIPGYSVKNVKFYQSASATSGTEAYLYSTVSGGSIPNGGECTITYTPPSTPATGHTQPTLAWTTTGSSAVTYDSYIDFGNAVTTSGTTWTGWADYDYHETSGEIYLGRYSNEATKSPYVSVLPNPDNTSDLYLKVDFTLVSRDGYGEEINVTGATAVVPAAYAKWQPNYNYTYVFKISDETNATIGSITGLYPITLNAQVVTDAVGNQETITTVAEHSITTYQKNSEVFVANASEYKAGTIYVIVDNGTELTVDTNAKLYTASVTSGTANITEASVANAIANPSNPKDANGNPLIVTAVASGLTAFDKILANDAPHGVDLTINGAKFTATAGTTYVFEYIVGSDKYYKVIKVASGS